MKVSLKNVTKNFGEKMAVNNISVDFEDGKLISILGSSGCGKSTTLNLIAGLENLSSGKIFYDDIDVSNLETEKRNIGMIFQNYALYPHMSVYDNIAFPLKMKKYKKNEIKDLVEEAADLVKIKHLINNKPSELSGGEQQRVAIARAIVKKPDLLLMDEPFSNLDKKLRTETRMEIRNLQKQLNITTIFVTHDQEEAMSISDEIVLMSDGNIIQTGEPLQIYNDPKNLISAKFFGDGNLNGFDAEVKDNIIYIDKKKTNYRVKINDQKCSLAFRPEDVLINTDNPLITVRAKSYQITGRSILVYASYEDLDVEFYLDKGDMEIEGKLFDINVPVSKIMLFDQTGERIYEEIK